MIITNNEEALRVKCDDVNLNEVGELIDKLEYELTSANKFGANGIGLAAPQIGVSKNIAIIRMPDFNVNLINCKIDSGFDPIYFQQEGCLSFPGRIETTKRFQEVHISNNLVKPHKFIVTGFYSIACQHEIDHLNSILFIDRVEKKKIKARPNDPCPCGAVDINTGVGKKYKRCCGA